jgi:hypothetical protein
MFINIGVKTSNYSLYNDQYVAYKQQTDELCLLVSIFRVQSQSFGLQSEFQIISPLDTSSVHLILQWQSGFIYLLQIWGASRE